MIVAIALAVSIAPRSAASPTEPRGERLMPIELQVDRQPRGSIEVLWT